MLNSSNFCSAGLASKLKHSETQLQGSKPWITFAAEPVHTQGQSRVPLITQHFARKLCCCKSEGKRGRRERRGRRQGRKEKRGKKGKRRGEKEEERKKRGQRTPC